MLAQIAKFIVVTAFAGGSFYGIYRLAKWRGVFDKDPIVPATGPGVVTGTPAKPK